jgi:hypothetical protein
MFITENLILLEYPKAASSYLRRFIRLYYGFNVQKKGVHNPIISDEIYKEVDNDAIKVLGSVRNPYSFYVSLRAFDIQNTRKDGNDNRIGLNRLFFTKPGLKPIVRNPVVLFRDLSDWKDTYVDSYSTKNFQRWIELFIDKKTQHVHPLYAKISHRMGYATYLYFMLYTKHFNKNYKELLNQNISLEDYYQEFEFPIEIVKTETAYDGLIRASISLNLDKDKVIKLQDEMLQKKKHFNASKRKTYIEYYSKEIIELVAQKDKWLIEKYNYKFI